MAHPCNPVVIVKYGEGGAPLMIPGCPHGTGMQNLIIINEALRDERCSLAQPLLTGWGLGHREKVRVRVVPVSVMLSWASRVGACESTFWAFSRSSCSSVNGGCLAIPEL